MYFVRLHLIDQTRKSRINRYAGFRVALCDFYMVYL